jgi:LacI family transcriptional regulator
LDNASFTAPFPAKARENQNSYFFPVIFAHDSGAFTADMMRGVQSAERMLRAFGFTVRVETVIAYTAKKQLELLENYERSGVSGIVIVPILDARIVDKLNALDSLGIPVITFNSDIEGTRRRCFIGANNHREGRTAGGLLEGLLTAGSETLVIAASTELGCHVGRVNGFRERLNEGERGVRMSGIVENHDNDRESRAILTKRLKDSPPAGIYLTGGGARGLGDALRRVGAERPRVVCHDVTPETVQLLREGLIDFTIGQDPHSQGFMPLRILFDLVVKNESPVREIFHTNVDIYTKENCETVEMAYDRRTA